MRKNVFTRIRRMRLAPILSVMITIPSSIASYAQSIPPTASSAKMEFDVTSVRENRSADFPTSNFPLFGKTNVQTGGLFRATQYRLISYIAFAYNTNVMQTHAMSLQLPTWALKERFDIEARVEGNPSRDQMRLMMQSLLADRFKLVIHTETRKVTVDALTLAKTGKTGPQLKPDTEDNPCVGAFCGVILPAMPKKVSNGVRITGKDVSMSQLADYMVNMPGVTFELPVIDETHLTGTFDFDFEFMPESKDSTTPGLLQLNQPGPTFEDVLRDQLGLKIGPSKKPLAVEFTTIDHIEYPSSN